MKEKLIGIAQAVLVALVILSGAIAVPVLCRPFFYLHIKPLNLETLVGLTAGEVKNAYNEMMDFCIGITDTFSAGVLTFSQAGASHFADVRRLFVLDLRVLIVSALLLCAIMLLRRKKPARLLGYTPGFWGAIGLSVTFAVVGGLAALDFDRAFVVFHTLFFPGKDNWLLDRRQDPIIAMLPVEFFRNCVILILAGILLSCGILILWNIWKRKRAPRL